MCSSSSSALLFQRAIAGLCVLGEIEKKKKKRSLRVAPELVSFLLQVLVFFFPHPPFSLFPDRVRRERERRTDPSSFLPPSDHASPKRERERNREMGDDGEIPKFSLALFIFTFKRLGGAEWWNKFNLFFPPLPPGE